ncbi:MAG: hypothetical protein O2931_07605 [Planctomycetota bacterium]|nr:hypothetical protein [Planctomycetota bacterium]MDA1178646.1 hypothetical protein [Planctomycetota bacterium]
MNRYWKIACSVLLSGGLWGGSFARPVEANHEIQSVHREFRARIRGLDAWYRGSLDQIRYRFERERDLIDCAMRGGGQNPNVDTTWRIYVMRWMTSIAGIATKSGVYTIGTPVAETISIPGSATP